MESRLSYLRRAELELLLACLREETLDSDRLAAATHWSPERVDALFGDLCHRSGLPERFAVLETARRTGMLALPAGACPLTGSQLRLLALYASGDYRCDQDLARAAGVSPLTVKGHFRDMLQRASVHTRGALVAAAMRAGWLAPPLEV